MKKHLHLLLALIFLPTGVSQAQFPKDVTKVPVVFSGGHDTDPQDRGRPVLLIAAALEVKPEVFRDAFSRIRPAGPGSGGPTGEEARKNKAALMSTLGKYGITNHRLDTVSNYYRYPPGPGGIWTHREAIANALIKGDAVVGYEITSGGSGYSSVPTVSVPGYPEATAHVGLSFGQNMETNGAVSTLTLPKKTK